MKQLILLVLVAIVLVSCDNLSKTEREGEPVIYNVEDTDEGMNLAIEKAKERFVDFENAFTADSMSFSDFAIKCRFKTESGGEHMWLTDVTVQDGNYYGVINNVPENTSELKFGDTVKIVKDNISDWMYVDNGRLRGGYTIREIRNRLTDTERKQFDSEIGLIVEE